MNREEEIKICKNICFGKGYSCKKWCVNFRHETDCSLARKSIIKEIEQNQK